MEEKLFCEVCASPVIEGLEIIKSKPRKAICSDCFRKLKEAAREIEKILEGLQ